jgi:possible biotin synthesis protein bioY
MKAISVKQMSLAAIMTAVTCILSPISLNIGPVPISLGTFAVSLSVCILGRNLGMLSYLLYLLLGFIGLPVFSNYGAGVEKLLGPTGGYLIGMIFLAFIGGFAVEKFSKSPIKQYLGLMLGIAFCYLLGTLWLGKVLSMDFGKALSVGVIPFILPDAIKVLLALVLGKKIRGRLSFFKE